MARQTKIQLPDTSYVVMGLLSLGEPLTGYEIRQRAEHSLRHFWTTPAMSQIYRDLGRLETLALIEAVTGDNDARRSRGKYRLTRAGRAELTRWLKLAPEPVSIHHPAVLRLAFGHLLDPNEVREALEAHRVYVDAALAELAELESKADPTTFGEAVAKWGTELYGAERDATEGARRRVAAAAKKAAKAL